MTPDARLRVASALAVRHAVGEAARVLAPAGILPLVLKGALLQTVYGADPVERVASDVDLLVPPERLDEAHARLVAAGYRPVWCEPDDRERVLTVPSGGLQIDLHGALFHRGQFALSTASLLSRASVELCSFDVPVLVPEPLDVFAHLVGHGAETWLALRGVHHPGDLDLVASKAALDARRAVAHLVRHGLASAAGWWLPMADAVHPSAFVRAVLEALPRPMASRLTAACVSGLGARVDPRSAMGLVLHKTLHRTPAAALRSVLGAVARTMGRRIRA